MNSIFSLSEFLFRSLLGSKERLTSSYSGSLDSSIKGYDDSGDRRRAIDILKTRKKEKGKIEESTQSEIGLL